jgi:hypothetical protein
MNISTSCANQDVGKVGDPKVCSRFGQLLSSAPGREHRQAFQDWISLKLELQFTDLEEFLDSLPAALRIDLEDRLSKGAFADLVPDDAPLSDRMLFQTDLETLLMLRQPC